MLADTADDDELAEEAIVWEEDDEVLEEDDVEEGREVDMDEPDELVVAVDEVRIVKNNAAEPINTIIITTTTIIEMRPIARRKWIA